MQVAYLKKRGLESSMVCEESCISNLMSEKVHLFAVSFFLFKPRIMSRATFPQVFPSVLCLMGWEVAGDGNLIVWAKYITAEVITHPGGMFSKSRAT